jgi:glycosyltransferase involved in cell wall biosynthesis
LRVLHVNKFLYRRGGAESYMFDLAKLQTDAGDEVAFFGMDHPDNLPMPYASHFPSYVEFRPASMSMGLLIRGTARMLYSRSAEVGIEAVIADFRPDVVHLHNIYHQLSPSVLRPLARAGIPAVMTLHDYKLACPTYQFLDHGKICEACLGGHFYHAATHRCKDGSAAASLLASIESYAHGITRAYAPVRLFIAPSRFLAAKMAEAGVFPERMRLLNHFIDAGPIGVAEGEGGGFVFAGRLSPEKGVDVLIKAAGQLAGVKVDILGDGPERPGLERLAADVAPGRVRFRGRLDKDSVHAAMRSALAVVVPSRWYENQPMTILEAFACGVPVIGSRIGGIPELVTDGVSGYTVAPDDPAALAERMLELVSAPAHARELGLAARAQVVAGFAPVRHLKGIADLYAEAGCVAEALVS